ncbi:MULTISPECIES: amidohydrolase family protein [unclassified Haladaptatus]|uniref:amidohydrolase family protein n=1 Tax=unclassified Haladaptatus TaxID=2622732 RepID=UPI0023E8370A|nr:MULTISPECIES: amidohydrolase family protein [unclassified Haladaptatus]
MELTGTILTGRSFDPIEGRVVVEDGRITAIEETSTDSTDIILPAFVNAHTHIGDSIAKEAGGGLSLDELVAPPDGLKHRLLRAADRADLVAAMRRSIQFMAQSGTASFIEFREGGTDGVEALRDAADGLLVEPVILGREEIEAMELADGYGASGARDAEFSRERTATKNAGKLFGIHAGERDELDINAALDLEPDFLVHMVHPKSIHYERVEDNEIPIVVCPRSNLVTKVGLPPIAEWVERTTVALGTDNVMLNSPSMFREMEFTAKLTDVPAAEILRMATVNGAEITGLDYGVVEEGKRAKLQVLDGDSHNLTGAKELVRAVVRRAGASDVKDVVL